LPLYEYRCTQCGHHFEKIQSFNADPESACPKCGGSLQRPLTAPALQFKGAGWYVNDYAPKAASGSTGSATESASPAADAKPAATETPAAKPAPSTPSS
jgi:putative FmdB family regulatory protein